MKYESITGDVIKSFYKVYNTLGFGFLEKVYENALKLELSRFGYDVKQQSRIKVFYEQEQVGDYYADLLINDVIIIELKAAENLCPEHEAQLLHYLKATEIEVGLLLNFGKKAQFKRLFYTNDIKNSRTLIRPNP